MHYIYTLANKGLAFQRVQEFIAFVKRHYNIDIKRCKRFTDRANSLGIAIERSAPYTPEQNGAAERSGV